MRRISTVLLGRIIGAAIIVAGTTLVIWNGIDASEYVSNVDIIRFSVQAELGWLASGGLIYVAAEILDQVFLRRTERRGDEQSDSA